MSLLLHTVHRKHDKIFEIILLCECSVDNSRTLWIHVAIMLQALVFYSRLKKKNCLQIYLIRHVRKIM